MTISWLALTILTLDCIWKCFAIKCLECTDIPTPSTCDKVTTCTANSSCVVHGYITTSGIPLYTTGCMSDERCKQPKQGGRSADFEPEEDLTLCNDCCNDGDYCNLNGCGVILPSANQRGLYCFECPTESAQYGCRTVLQCDQGFSCAIWKSTFSGYYSSGCMSQEHCSASPQTDGGAIHVVGRSSGPVGLHLPYCCTSDFCNDLPLLRQNTTHGVWSSWSDWSSCSNTCGSPGTQTRYRACDSGSTHNAALCLGDAVNARNCTTVATDACTAWCLSHSHYKFDVHSHLCYAVTVHKRSEDHASGHCKNEGGTLAVIDTPERWTVIQSDLLDNYSHTGLIYIGGKESPHSHHEFQWPSGAPLNFTAWVPDQPNGGECIVLDPDHDYRWRDKDCDDKYWYMCTISET